MGDEGDAIDKKIDARMDAYTRVSSAGDTARNFLSQTKVFRQSVNAISKAFGSFSQVLAIVLVLFILHQVRAIQTKHTHPRARALATRLVMHESNGKVTSASRGHRSPPMAMNL